MSTTTVTLNGNLTSDPEIKYGETGSVRLGFGIAVNYYWNDQSGERQEKTSFFNVVAWKTLAEDAANVLEKGMRVLVIGRIEQRTFTDKDGNNRSIVEVVAEEIGTSVRGIESVTRKVRSEGGQNSGPARKAPARQSTPSKGRKPVAASVGEESEPF